MVPSGLRAASIPLIALIALVAPATGALLLALLRALFLATSLPFRGCGNSGDLDNVATDLLGLGHLGGTSRPYGADHLR